MEASTPVFVEPPVGYHSFCTEVLTRASESRFGTVSGGRFDWGGRLLKGNGGAQRFPQRGWKSREECKGKRELDRETNKSTWYESRA
jgi:hypothetical protein